MIDAIAKFIVELFFGLLPIVGTVLLIIYTFKFWVHYVRQDFISGIDWVLLEIIPPREVLRSPLAMELFFTNSLYQWSMKGWAEEYWQGAVWFWFSLEIASIEGQVHFYIRTPSRIKGLIETQMYAQYPQAQVREVEDYTLAVDEISPKSSWNGWGCEFKLVKPEAYPIKTYVDFGLEKDPKEEFKVDPISPVIELFGSIGKGEQMWVQIVIKAAKRNYHTPGTWFKSHDWVQEARNQVEKILKPYTRHYPKIEGETGHSSSGVYTPPFLVGSVEGILHKRTKLGFDCGVRTMYIAKKEAYINDNRRNLRLIFRQYASPNMNQFYRINSAQGDLYSWSSVFISKNKVMGFADRLLHEYRERSFFHLPIRHHIFSENVLFWPISPFIFPAFKHHAIFVLNIEELATIWHFPGQILKVPTLERIESKEASPPPNLPT